MNDDLPSLLIESLDRWIPQNSQLRRMSPNTAATVIVLGCLSAVLVAAIFFLNLGVSDVSLLGTTLAIPLSLQWLLSFVAGAIVALRIKHRHDTNLRTRVEAKPMPYHPPVAPRTPVRSSR